MLLSLYSPHSSYLEKGSKKEKCQARWRWRTPLVPVLGRKRQAGRAVSWRESRTVVAVTQKNPVLKSQTPRKKKKVPMNVWWAVATTNTEGTPVKANLPGGCLETSFFLNSLSISQLKLPAHYYEDDTLGLRLCGQKVKMC